MAAAEFKAVEGRAVDEAVALQARERAWRSSSTGKCAASPSKAR